jgi:menaquinone-dependent protoporphyrinogen oxidase
MSHRILVLILYASRYGSTREIAERIASRLEHRGLSVDLAQAGELRTIGNHDAVVAGSAVYFGSWMKEAAEFVRGNASMLLQRPVWLFSSGPLGVDITARDGGNVENIWRPREFDAFEAAIRPRDHRVFPGTLHRRALRGVHRLLRLLPGSRKLLLEGDFRNWREVEAWADGIADELLRLQRASLPEWTVLESPPDGNERMKHAPAVVASRAG